MSTYSPNQTHLTSADFVAAILVFGAVAAMTEVVRLHLVPLNF